MNDFAFERHPSSNRIATWHNYLAQEVVRNSSLTLCIAM